MPVAFDLLIADGVDPRPALPLYVVTVQRAPGKLPLCLLTQDMQNRRIIDGLSVNGRAGKLESRLKPTRSWRLSLTFDPAPAGTPREGMRSAAVTFDYPHSWRRPCAG